MKKMHLRRIAFAGILAAAYAAVTIASAPIAYGAVQFRIAEAMMVLCCFTPTAIWGLTLGCLLANLFSTVTALDIVFGTAATLLACLLTRKLKSPWLVPLPTIAVNGLMIGAELAIFANPGQALLPAFCLNALLVAAGEAVVMLALGVPLYLFLRKTKAGQLVGSY